MTWTRRDFLKTTAVAAAGLMAAGSGRPPPETSPSGEAGSPGEMISRLVGGG